MPTKTVKKPTKKSVKTKRTSKAKKVAKTVARKPALKLVAKKQPKKTSNAPNLFRQLLAEKEQRRQEPHTQWFKQEHGQGQSQFDNRKHAQFGRYNGPRRKAA